MDKACRTGTPAQIILSMRQANERRRYIVTLSLIVWAHAEKDPWSETLISVSL